MGLFFKVRVPQPRQRRENLPRTASFRGNKKTEFDEARHGNFILAKTWTSIWGRYVVILCKGMIRLFFGADHFCVE